MQHAERRRNACSAEQVSRIFCNPPEKRIFEDALEGQENTRTVRAALEALPEKQRLTVIMKILEERTHAEVAEILGSSVGTVKGNLFFAIRNLRKLLAATADFRATGGRAS